MEKKLSILLYVLMGLSVVLSIFLFSADIDVEGTDPDRGGMPVELILDFCYILVGIAVAAAIIFPAVKMAQDVKSAKSSLMSFAGLLVIFGVSYALASSEVLKSYEEYVTDEAVVKRVGAAINAFYVLAVGTIGATIYSEVSSYMK
ncbi:MAG: hypothetical protein HRT71_00680 [Flavobacteriales bacterium]|nr:hypothetical protein [Flavobacteriales bacterium]